MDHPENSSCFGRPCGPLGRPETLSSQSGIGIDGGHLRKLLPPPVQNVPPQKTSAGFHSPAQAEDIFCRKKAGMYSLLKLPQ
jgi:hypothetical protein